jgi:alkanesulfonate monooxygenase SsuD/methylene tetrahydromethanopterin reductase-like flavin-dependent oxidoreductase (luciferase family)
MRRESAAPDASGRLSETGPTANHPGAWRHPEASLHDGFAPERHAHLARLLEAAGFYAGTFGPPDIHGGKVDASLRHGGQTNYLDPLMILPVMARVTQHLGLGATLSATFMRWCRRACSAGRCCR